MLFFQLIYLDDETRRNIIAKRYKRGGGLRRRRRSLQGQLFQIAQRMEENIEAVGVLSRHETFLSFFSFLMSLSTVAFKASLFAFVTGTETKRSESVKINCEFKGNVGVQRKIKQTKKQKGGVLPGFCV